MLDLKCCLGHLHPASKGRDLSLTLQLIPGDGPCIWVPAPLCVKTRWISSPWSCLAPTVWTLSNEPEDLEISAYSSALFKYIKAFFLQRFCFIWKADFHTETTQREKETSLIHGSYLSQIAASALAGSFFWISHMNAEFQASFYCFSRCISRGLDWKWSQHPYGMLLQAVFYWLVHNSGHKLSSVTSLTSSYCRSWAFQTLSEMYPLGVRCRKPPGFALILEVSSTAIRSGLGCGSGHH